MRFRFCGDLDCPDWVLAEIGTLSRLTSIKMKLLSTQVVKCFITEVEPDFEKVAKLTADAKFSDGDVRGSLAALRSILTSSAKHDVDAEALNSELQQLGLPREHAVALCRVYSDQQAALRATLCARTLTLDSVTDVKWRVDYVISASEFRDVKTPVAHVTLDMRGADSGCVTPLTFCVDAAKLDVLVHELRQARDVMERHGVS